MNRYFVRTSYKAASCTARAATAAPEVDAPSWGNLVNRSDESDSI